jgi:hypothetical protein
MKLIWKIPVFPEDNLGEQGFVLVVALVMLAILSVLGITTLNTTDRELQISGNERQEKQVFFGTESGCTRGGQWLRNLQLSRVEEYADSDLLDSYRIDNNFSKGLSVHDIVLDSEESNLGGANYPVKYLYSIREREDNSGARLTCLPIPGEGPLVLDCFYQVVCSANVGGKNVGNIGIGIAKPTDFK